MLLCVLALTLQRHREIVYLVENPVGGSQDGELDNVNQLAK